MTDDEHDRRAHERIGTVLNGKYRLDAIIGVGGMAVVYRATHRNRAEFALKMLHPELSHNPEVRARLLREGYSANSVKHPGVVLVTDDDVAEDGSAFLVMELLDGASVEELWTGHGQRLPLSAVLAIAAQVLDVLAAAHAAQIVHRDIKPANLFVTRDGTVKVLDFGIARVWELARAGIGSTGAGMPIGTPSYMAPEQALGRSADVGSATDVWALGATIFTLLSGETVHSAATGAEMIVHAATRPARSIASVAPDVPASIAAVVDRALAFDRASRWPDARAMGTALADACADLPGGVPSRAALLTLLPKAVSIAPRSQLSSRVTSDIASAPTVSASDLPGPHSGETALPIASTRHAVPQARPAVRGRWAIAAAVALTALVAVGLWLRTTPVREAATPVAAAPAAVGAWAGGGPVYVIILGSENRSSEAELDGTLETVLASALQRSPQIYPFSGKMMRGLLAELAPGVGGRDEEIGRAVAERAHMPVVLVHETVASLRDGYVISLVATDGVSQARVADLREQAAGKDRIVPAVAALGCSLRAALHDVPCDPASREHVGVSRSVEADHAYVLAAAAFATGRYDEAVAGFQKALGIDPGFTMAHNALGLMLLNLHRPEEGRAQLKYAAAHREELSDREWLEVTATYHLLMDEFDQAAQAYEERLARWPAETVQRGNLAAAYSEAGDLDRALAAGRQAATEHPTVIHARSNLPLFLLLTGRLEEATEETKAVLAAFPHPVPGMLVCGALPYALLGRREEALALFAKLDEVDPSEAVSSRADFALFEGRLDDAEALLRAGIAKDEKGGLSEAARQKWAMLGELGLRAGRLPLAREGATRAGASSEIVTLFRAARVDALTGRASEATTLARIISAHPGLLAPRYARIIAADIVAASHGTKESIVAAMGDIGRGPGAWLAHADLGAAFLGVGELEAAERELDPLVAAPGQGSSAFFDDTPTLRYLPHVRFGRARAKDALRRPDAVDAYRALLAGEPSAQNDPLAAEARRRAGR